MNGMQRLYEDRWLLNKITPIVAPDVHPHRD